MYRRIHPSILYFGTPVVLLSTLRPDGTPNLTPMSSAWALGDRVFLGLADNSQGAENLRRTGECVINLPSAAMWPQVERIARCTGRRDVPAYKRAMGYAFEPRPFERAGLVPVASQCVRPPRAAPCPLQLEARLLAAHTATVIEGEEAPGFHALEVQVVAVHADEAVLHAGSDHIDVRHWHPLLYVFRHYVAGSEWLGSNFRAERAASPGTPSPALVSR